MCRENSDLEKRIGQAKLDRRRTREGITYQIHLQKKKKVEKLQLFSVKSTT